MYHVILVALVACAIAFGYFIGQVWPLKPRRRPSNVTVHLSCDTSDIDKKLSEFSKRLSESVRRTGIDISHQI